MPCRIDSLFISMDQMDQPVGVEQHQSKSPFKMFLYGLAVVIAIAAVVAGALAFRATRNVSTNPAVVKFAKALGISVAKVNGLSVPYAEYAEDLAILNAFYETQGAGEFSESDISDQVLSRLVVSVLIKDYAKRYDVVVTKDEVIASPFLAQLIAPFGTREVAEKEVQTRYGLSFDQYLDKVVHPVLLEQKLQEEFGNSTDETGKGYEENQVKARHILFTVDDKNDEEVKKKAQGVLDRVKKGEDFATLAAEFGEDGTKDTGGDLGWFGQGRMVPEFEEAVFDKEPGLLSELVKTQFGYHIVQVDEQRNGRNYTAFMGDQIRLATVEVLIPKVHNPFAAPDAAYDPAPTETE